jgi:hypothetical protein
MGVYKYLKKKYLNQLIEKGIIRIGTIYWYRDCENKKIRDPLEGRTKYTIKPRKESLTLSKEQAQAITNDYRIKGNICISPETTFSDYLNVSNAFIFCASLYYDNKLFKKFEADTCYKIGDIEAFASNMGKEINKQFPLRLIAMNEVVYVHSKEKKITKKNINSVIRNTPYNDSGVKTIYVEDYFTKPMTYREEVEYRFIFLPHDKIKKDCFVFIKNKKIADFCEVIER